MKKLLSNLKFTFTALLATGVILMTQSAFRSSSKQDSNSYYFTGNSVAEMRILENWTASPGSGEICSGVDLPCMVILENDMTLDEYINSKTDSEIISSAYSRKSQH